MSKRTHYQDTDDGTAGIPSSSTVALTCIDTHMDFESRSLNSHINPEPPSTAPAQPSQLVFRPAPGITVPSHYLSGTNAISSQPIIPFTGLGQPHAGHPSSTVARAENARLMEIMSHMGFGKFSQYNVDYYAQNFTWPPRDPSKVEITFQFSVLLGKTVHYSTYTRTVSADKMSKLSAFQAFAKAERNRVYQFADLFQPQEELQNMNLLIELHYDHGTNKGEFITIAGESSISRWYEEQILHGACEVLRARIAYLEMRN